MLRMEFYELPNCMKMRIEGRFVHEFAEHARTLVGQSIVPSKLVVDLSEVSFVDTVGEEVLLWFKNIGVRFAAESAYSRDVCERLQLPMEAGESPDSQNGRGTPPRRTRPCHPGKRANR